MQPGAHGEAKSGVKHVRKIRGIGESNRRYSFAIVEHPRIAERKTYRRNGAHEKRLHKVGGMWVVWYRKSRKSSSRKCLSRRR